MSRLSILASVLVLSVSVTSTIQPSSAKMRHHAKAQPISAQGSERYFGGPKSESWRDSNAAIPAAPSVPSSIYTGGWSAPAGR
ncbi:hypothetical protein ABIC09_000006 [Bradyrhizobium sp. S3.12.5]